MSLLMISWGRFAAWSFTEECTLFGLNLVSRTPALDDAVARLQQAAPARKV